MNSDTAAQGVVVALLLLWSAGFLLRHLAPAAMRRAQTFLAHAAHQQGWLSLAAWLQPTAAVAAGCASACHDCSPSCASQTSSAAQVAQPIRWK